MARLLAAAPQQTLPVLRGGRAARPNAECQPGYDGLPDGAQGLRAFDYDYDYDYD